ncbi:LysR family transcriptional regulator [Shewanella chilikensis]|uniref:LysR family transcriptional regulator n=1 Tax=Shewanella chilikensis TaxID=558541 RepID=UPI001F2AE7A2|nr:LysR family transcriptional regulator [Shewanella chilikensis]MCE9788960.1 LysR family transcriptional regulator [Shewanella chilikensis]
MLTTEQLEAFVASVETGSFSAAARQLGKVQSGISQQIMNLELDTGLQLFDRSGRYPQLTAAGHHLLPYAKAVLAQHRRLTQQVSGLGSDASMEVILAVDEGIPYTRLSDLLRQLEQEFPQICLSLLCASSKDVITLVKEGKATMGLLFSEPVYPETLGFETLDFETIGTVTFELLVSPKHPLAEIHAMHTDILKLHRQLAIGSKYSSHFWFDQVHSPDVWFADNYYVLLELAKQGFGWALLPKPLAQEAMSKGELQTVKLDFELGGWQANVDVLQSSASQVSRVNVRMRQLLRELLKKQ